MLQHYMKKMEIGEKKKTKDAAAVMECCCATAHKRNETRCN